MVYVYASTLSRQLPDARRDPLRRRERPRRRGIQPAQRVPLAPEHGAETGRCSERLPEPRPPLSLEIVPDNPKDTVFFHLGPHPPRLWPEDVELAHQLWLEISATGPGAKLHHRDVIGVALRRMIAELHSDRSGEVVDDVFREVSGGAAHGAEPPE
jgi:hypothetical protein